MRNVVNRFIKKAYMALLSRTVFSETLTAFYSFLMHLRFSFSDRTSRMDKERLEYYIVKQCHIVEKGLALPDPRKGFGQPKILNLINRTREYEALAQRASQPAMMVRDTLREYLAFHAQDLSVLPNNFLNSIKGFIDGQQSHGKGGLIKLRKAEMQTYGADSFEKFLKSRRSIRNFSTVPVNDEIILRALEISQNTPSVCNRQGWLVHYYHDKKVISELLSFQNGNTGFTECIDKLLIVTASAKAFTRYEHNQLFVDGGLYSMNLMLALHAIGLGSCPLNTCMPWFKESRLKRAADIPKHERLIMMIAVGNLMKEFSVAQSEKYPVEKIVSLH